MARQWKKLERPPLPQESRVPSWLLGLGAVLTFNLLVGSSSYQAQAAPQAALALENAFVDVAAHAKPAVVNISVVQEQRVQVPYYMFGDPQDFFQQFMQGPTPRYYKFKSQGTGAGFLINPDGYCITNDHVVRQATEIRVTLTGASGREKTYRGKVIGHDSNLDLAVVKIESNEKFPYLELTEEPPRVGQWAIAIGSPFALEQTVTAGIISAQRQTLYIEGRRYPNLIQTDAAINSGNSGGPLLDIQGKVIGVNTAIFSPSGGSVGIGFAIPASEVKRVVGYLMAGKQMHLGWLGIETQGIDDVIQKRLGLPSTDGALVNSVFPKSPAEKSGLRRGDVIQRFNGKKIEDPEALVQATSLLEAGAEVSLEVSRHSKPITLMAKLGERPQWANQENGRPPANQSPEAEAPQESGTFKWEGVEFNQTQEGVTVAGVAPDSALAGSLLQGDIIHGINDETINNLDDLKRTAKKIKITEGIFLDIVRQGQPLYISVKP